MILIDLYDVIFYIAISLCIICLVAVIGSAVIPCINPDPHETNITIQDKHYYTTTTWTLAGKVMVPITNYHYDVTFTSEGQLYTEDNEQIYNLDIGKTYKVVRNDYWFLGSKHIGRFEMS